MIGLGLVDQQLRSVLVRLIWHVIVEKSATARNGQTVVAILADEQATLKRYYREKGRVRLQPANSSMKPIYATQVEIRGIVRGVLRATK